MRTRRTKPWLLMLVACFATNLMPLHGQDAPWVLASKQVMLVADGITHGTVQWQSSPDAISWTDLPGLNADTALLFPAIGLMHYRAQITSGTCNPVYSTTHALQGFHCGDTITDSRDGQKYPTVQIGTQCWMGKNMNIGVMIDGTLPMLNDSIIQKYCFNNDTNSCNTYGALYQWNEMMQYTVTPGTRGICPAGWHVPTDQKYLNLEIYLGMQPSTATLMNTWRGTDEGAKIKQGGSSGFNANLTGLRYDGGLYYNEGTFEFLLTSNINPFQPTLALRRCLSITDPSIGRFNNTSITMGGSVRCLLNE